MLVKPQHFCLHPNRTKTGNCCYSLRHFYCDAVGNDQKIKNKELISYNETSENGSWILIYSKGNAQWCHARHIVISQLVRNSSCTVDDNLSIYESNMFRCCAKNQSKMFYFLTFIEPLNCLILTSIEGLMTLCRFPKVPLNTSLDKLKQKTSDVFS